MHIDVMCTNSCSKLQISEGRIYLMSGKIAIDCIHENVIKSLSYYRVYI